MKKILITGASGFVGRHFIEYLGRNGIESQVLGVGLTEDTEVHTHSPGDYTFRSIDLLDRPELERLFLEFQPEYVLHLAAHSSVAFSWKEPMLTFQNNTNVFLNLVETVRRLDLECRILSVGSSEIYGNVDPDRLPLREDSPLEPVSTYAVARVSQELLSQVYIAGYGLDLVITRSFNHIGPGQKDLFAVASFAKQIAEIKKSGKKDGVLATGDLRIVRDFLDVRDVVRAYDLLLQNGKRGEVYNICSGQGYSLQEVVDGLASIAGIEITTRVNPAFIRPTDNRVIMGSNKKIHDELGWSPHLSLRQSLKDILSYWEERV